MYRESRFVGKRRCDVPRLNLRAEDELDLPLVLPALVKKRLQDIVDT
jgi:hypothetical protein